MILPGSPVRTDNVEPPASMLDGDELAVKLERAVPNENALVALSPTTGAERTRGASVKGSSGSSTTRAVPSASPSFGGSQFA